MKTLTLTQPWASLVACGAKRIETRSWSTSYRGSLAIHAAKGFPADAKDFTYAKLTRDCLLAGNLGLKVERSFYEGGGVHRLDTQLPRGSIVATCQLVDVLPTVSVGCLSGVFEDWPDLDTEQERAFGNYDPGRFAWVLENVEMLGDPIAAKGALGLWEWKPLYSCI